MGLIIEQDGGFSDLAYSAYPAVDSDERYAYNDLQLENIPYVNEYEALLLAVKTAATADDRSAAWITLDAFQKTEEYIKFVEPVILNAIKMQRLEDCLLACQRVAKRQTQQWVVSDTQPEDVGQLVNDIWFKPDPDKSSSDGIPNYLMYQKTSDGYVGMNIQNHSYDITEIKVVDKLPSDAASHPTTFYLLSETRI